MHLLNNVVFYHINPFLKRNQLHNMPKEVAQHHSFTHSLTEPLYNDSHQRMSQLKMPQNMKVKQLSSKGNTVPRLQVWRTLCADCKSNARHTFYSLACPEVTEVKTFMFCESESVIPETF